MSHRIKKSGDVDRFPINLAVAERLAKQLGNTVSRGEASLPDGKKVPILLVNHGEKPIILRSENDILSIAITIDIPEDVRKNLSSLDDIKHQKFDIALKNQLLSNARTGYLMIPQHIKKLSELQSIVIEQRIYISDRSLNSYNRFADAIQEVVTVAVRAMLVFGILPPADSTSSKQTLPPPPPDGMYA